MALLVIPVVGGAPGSGGRTVEVEAFCGLEPRSRAGADFAPDRVGESRQTRPRASGASRRAPCRFLLKPYPSVVIRGYFYLLPKAFIRVDRFQSRPVLVPLQPLQDILGQLRIVSLLRIPPEPLLLARVRIQPVIRLRPIHIRRRSRSPRIQRRNQQFV